MFASPFFPICSQLAFVPFCLCWVLLGLPSDIFGNSSFVVFSLRLVFSDCGFGVSFWRSASFVSMFRWSFIVYSCAPVFRRLVVTSAPCPFQFRALLRLGIVIYNCVPSSVSESISALVPVSVLVVSVTARAPFCGVLMLCVLRVAFGFSVLSWVASPHVLGPPCAGMVVLSCLELPAYVIVQEYFLDLAPLADFQGLSEYL